MENKVRELVKLHTKIRANAAAIKENRKKYNALKNEINEFMFQEDLELVEAGDVELVCRKRKPGTTVTKKFLVEKLKAHFSDNDGVDVDDAVDFVFASKPKPKIATSLSIRKRKKPKKTKKLVDAKPEIKAVWIYNIFFALL